MHQEGTSLGIKPVKHDKHGPLYSVDDVEKIIINDASTGQYSKNRFKKMSKEIESATSDIESASKQFNTILNNMLALEAKAAESCKKVSGNVRASANDLASGLLKLQKTADFNSLERHVQLLERAAAALSTLSELEKVGKLDKLIGAMK